MVKTTTKNLIRQYEKMMKGVNMPVDYSNYYNTFCAGAVTATIDLKQGVNDMIEERHKEEKERNVYQIHRRHYGEFTCLNEAGYSKRVRIDKVIFNPPATIILWSDKTRTVVKCREGEAFDKHTGFAMCVVKKLYGPDFHYILKKYGGKTEETEETEEQDLHMTLDEWTKQARKVGKALSSALGTMNKGGDDEL